MFLHDLTFRQIIALALFLETGFVVGAFAMALGNRRATAQTGKKRWVKFISYVVIVHVSVAALGMGYFSAQLFSLAIAMAGTLEMIRAVRHGGFYGRRTATGISGVFIFIALAGMMLLMVQMQTPRKVLFVYLVVAVLDSYSQLTGQIFGRHPLAPRISPNKSVEGALGGALMAVFTAVYFREFIGVNGRMALIVGVVLTLAGIAGDLMASAFKRFTGIKDYSSILPGQGGVIDRYNSFIAASAVFLVLIRVGIIHC
jgi:phosphatidate cytidylyltransferase